MALHAEAYWRSRFADDLRALEGRRRQGLAQVRSAAHRFHERWPELSWLWLFGSLLGQGFRAHSDLDLMAEGLPAGALIEAIAVAEAEGPLPVDLKRVEDLEPSLRQRLLRHVRPLLPDGVTGEGDAA